MGTQRRGARQMSDDDYGSVDLTDVFTPDELNTMDGCKVQSRQDSFETTLGAPLLAPHGVQRAVAPAASFPSASTTLPIFTQMYQGKSPGPPKAIPVFSISNSAPPPIVPNGAPPPIVPNGVPLPIRQPLPKPPRTGSVQ